MPDNKEAFTKQEVIELVRTHLDNVVAPLTRANMTHINAAHSLLDALSLSIQRQDKLVQKMMEDQDVDQKQSES